MRRLFTLPTKVFPLPFMGEWMQCNICGRKQKSDPHVESGWTCLTIDNERRVYVCDVCFENAEADGKGIEL